MSPGNVFLLARIQHAGTTAASNYSLADGVATRNPRAGVSWNEGFAGTTQLDLSFAQKMVMSPNGAAGGTGRVNCHWACRFAVAFWTATCLGDADACRG